MLESLTWDALPEGTARTLVARLIEVEEPGKLADYQIRGRIAPLAPYRAFRIVQLAAKYRPEAAWQETLYALWAQDGPLLLLNGQSAAIHDANAHEKLHLTENTVVDYLRVFLFAVRGDRGAFLLLEPAGNESATTPSAITRFAKPVVSKGQDPSGRFLLDAIVAYDDGVFTANFAVAADGNAEMLDDEPLAGGITPDELPAVPELGSGSALMAHMSAMRAGIAAAPGPDLAGEPPLQTLVELLLERALKSKSGHRLIESFGASMQPVSPLNEFAALVVQTSPVVIVESSLQFVEEIIGRIILERFKPPGAFELVTADVGTDDTEVSFRLKTQGPGMVLVPLQVYRRVTNVDRLAFDLASKDFSAIVACEQTSLLPDSLRRPGDIVLRLPSIDAATFEALFARAIGQPLPGGWMAGGTEWVKNVLHTDFDQPRRMKLPRDQALKYVHSQVEDRLGAVNVSGEIGLKELHGLGEARQFAEDLIADIHAAIKGEIDWAYVDRGALLVGPPGTGKTTLARAIAKDCGIRFLIASATGWQASGQHLGHHIAAIRKTFSEARQYAPSILFIDEIDSLGNRETFSGYAAQYSTEVVNAVLEQLQGMDPAAPVFVIGATNHEERVDPALRRSGRLDRVIHIPRPSTESLRFIYAHYLAKISERQKVDPGVDPKALGRLSLGLTGADVERIVRGAARRARKESRSLMHADVIAEITNKPRTADGAVRLSPSDIERIAHHEAGHALALFLGSSKGADIGFVTVVPRADGTLGFVAPMADERISLTRQDYQERIEVCLAGRAAEHLHYGADQISDGAGSDLQAASRLAMRMVIRLGLGKHRKLLWSEEPTAEDIACANDMLVEAYERILERLKGQQARLDALAAALAARQELNGDEVARILAK